MNQQIIENLPNYDYHCAKEYLEYISSSGLKTVLYNPFLFKWRRDLQIFKPPSKQQKLGSALHTLALEPENFERDVHVVPPNLNKRKKKDKEFYDEWEAELLAKNKETIILEEDQQEIVEQVREKLEKNTEVLELLSDGVAESSIFFEVGSAKYKVRPDYMRKDLIVDLKTTGKPLYDFGRSCVNYGYDLSAWFYCYGADIYNYKFLVIETIEPFSFGIFTPDKQFMATGKARTLKAMKIYEECAKTNNWPEPKLNQSLSLPRWYQKQAA